jgi:hypothetical protein
VLPTCGRDGCVEGGIARWGFGTLEADECGHRELRCAWFGGSLWRMVKRGSPWIPGRRLLHFSCSWPFSKARGHEIFSTLFCGVRCLPGDVALRRAVLWVITCLAKVPTPLSSRNSGTLLGYDSLLSRGWISWHSTLDCCSSTCKSMVFK